MRKFILLLLPALVFACKGNVSIGDDDNIDITTSGNNTDREVTDDGKVIIGDREIDPARVTIHRLNKAEYNNTMRDLLGDTTQPATSFPDDDFGYGFNNIADVLTVSTLHIEFYDSTATRLVDTALAGGGAAEESQRFEAETVGSAVGVVSGNEWNLFSNGAITTTVTFPADGDYRIVVNARQQAAGAEDAMMSVNIDNQTIQTFDVAPTTLTEFEVMTTVTAGTHSVSVEFLNDFFDMATNADRNLLVDYFDVIGPIGATGEPTGTRAEIMTCMPASAAENESCGREIISNFASRAWRRPAEDDAVDDLMGFIDLAISEGDDFETGIKLALRAILVSPNFMFRVEFDPDLTDATPHNLSEYELASRLSYFLWSSMPDQELFDLAEAGELSRLDVLREQVDRMMDDPKAIALVDNLATQWLHIDTIEDAMPDYEVFPNWTDDFKEDMRIETRMFIQEIFEENLSIRDVLLANYAWVNQDLAEHYGLPYNDNAFHRVEIPDQRRRGFLTQGSFLTITSRATRTAPSLRGDWILKNLLCEQPDDIPEGIDPIPEDPQPGLSLREQLEAHADTNSTCYSCHFEMDKFGLAMENYDGIGQWRDEDNGVLIDAAVEIPGVGPFEGVWELTDVLVDDPRYNDCLTKKFTTYGLGRGVEDWDQPQIDLIVENALEENLSIRDVFKEIVTSPAFMMRRGGDLPGEE